MNENVENLKEDVERLGTALTLAHAQLQWISDQNDVLCAVVQALVLSHPNKQLVETRAIQQLSEWRLFRSGTGQQTTPTPLANRLWVDLFGEPIPVFQEQSPPSA